MSDHIEILLGSILGFLLCFIIFGIYLGASSEKEFTQRCSADNGIAIYAGHREYCIKRSAFVEIVR